MKKIAYKKILVPLDGSRHASSVLPHVVSLAKIVNADIILLRVIHSSEYESVLMRSPGVGMYPDVLGDAGIEIARENKYLAEKQLKRVKTELNTNGIPHVFCHVEEGYAQNIILETASRENCDLIIMATHGLSGIARVLLGSVADYVIRHSVCPVLIIHPQQRDSARRKEVKLHDKRLTTTKFF